MFESFQRSLETGRFSFRPIPKVDPMPPRPGTRRRRLEMKESGPLLEEVMLARGMLHAVKKEVNRNE